MTYKHDWAPDGQHLVVSDNSESEPGRTGNVVTVRPDGSDWTYITHFPAGFRANTGGYSPDGQWIVFRLEGPGLVPTMYRIRPDGTDLHALYASSDIVPRFINWDRSARLRARNRWEGAALRRLPPLFASRTRPVHAVFKVGAWQSRAASLGAF